MRTAREIERDQRAAYVANDKERAIRLHEERMALAREAQRKAYAAGEEYCERCETPISSPEHAVAIGGGWSPLCGACAARLCACGALLLERDPLEGGNARLLPETDRVDFTLHAEERCTGVDGISGQRPNGCPCDACHGRRIDAARSGSK